MSGFTGGTADLRIEPLGFERRDVDRFLAVAERLYRDDRHWVAPLRSDARQVLSPRNPFFDHASIRLWVARRAGVDVGRIAAIVDRLHVARYQPRTGFFGFFECIDDAEVARRLFDAATEWVRGEGMERLLGPMNPSANDECGLLVEGFDSDPSLLMPYNPAYYPGLVTGAGFATAKNLLAFRIDVAGMPFERLERVVGRTRRQHPELVLRPVRRRTFGVDFPILQRVYADAWDENWGFVPPTEAEFRFTADRLLPLLTEGLVWLACWGDEPVGVLVTVLDFNEALKPLRGRMLGPGLLRALPYLLNWRRPRSARVILLGVRRAYRRRGIEAAMLFEGLKVARQLGIEWAEASWILEDNLPVIQTIGVQGGRVSKVYRLYDRALGR